MGGDDLAYIQGGTHLRRADGEERYVELGSGQLEPPGRGEVIYADDGQVLCRRWCWRQGEQTRIRPSSRTVVLNVHGLPPATAAEVEAATRELAELVVRELGGRSRWYLLDAGRPRVESQF